MDLSRIRTDDLSFDPPMITTRLMMAGKLNFETLGAPAINQASKNGSIWQVTYGLVM